MGNPPEQQPPPPQPAGQQQPPPPQPDDNERDKYVNKARGDLNQTISQGLMGDDLKTILDFIGEQMSPRRRVRKPEVEQRVVSQEQEPRDETEYAEQFLKLPLEEQIFVVVLVLFPEINWADFWGIYDLAAQEIIPVLRPLKKRSGQSGETEELPEPPPEVAARLQSDEHWAKVAHAEIKQSTIEYTEGKERTTTMDFRSPEIRTIAQQYFASKQRQWLMRMIPIIRKLGDHPYVVLRRKAAEAAVVIAGIDFDYVRREVLNPWSLSDNPATRAAVGYALDTMIKDGNNDAGAIALLDRWTHHDGTFSWRQCWTAASCYRFIGLHRFDLAEKDLKSLARLTDQIFDKCVQDQHIPPADLELIDKVPHSVVYTLTILSIQGKVQEVTTILHTWTMEEIAEEYRLFWDLTIMSAVSSIFDATIHIRKEQRQQNQQNQPDDAEATPPPPDFLDLMEHDPDMRKHLADILVRLFRKGADGRKSLFGMLENWVLQMHELDCDTEAIQRLLVNLFRRCNADNRERILKWLDRWSQHRNNHIHTLGTTTAAKLRSSNYPLPPEPRKTGNKRIVFGAAK